MRHLLTILFVFICVQASFGQLSGSLSGNIGPGIYHVIGDISVESGDSLTLQPGTTFHFDGYYQFEIYGTLLAEGTETDSIFFTTDTLSNPDRWRVLEFRSFTNSGGQLAYCVIQFAYNPNGVGAVCCNTNSSPSFTNCTISDNITMNGGGVYCGSSSPTFTNCTISGNSADVCGGGVGCGGSQCTPVFTNCILSGNSAGHRGGGVYCSWYSSPTFTNCRISGNSAGVYGGGVRCEDGFSGSFTNCVISGNTANDYGGGVHCEHSSLTFTNCTITGNSATYWSGVYCYASSPTFNSTIIAHGWGSGSIYFDGSSGSQFEYCDIFDNWGVHIGFKDGNPAHGPSSIGELVTTNTNDDSCDAYMNIFLDPMFVNPGEDFHLDDYSPCIGAADPTDPPPTDFEGNPRPNPPGSLPDIGAYEHWRDVPLPVELTTFQAFAGDRQVTLRWQTASELNNDHFVLYKRKTREEDFDRLTEIPGHGTIAEPHDYQFVDSWVQNGIAYDYQISDVDISGAETIHPLIISATPGRDVVPTEYALHQNFPNPFNPVTTIRYDVKEAGLVSLKVFDLLGREVTTLTYEGHSAGVYSVTWDAAGMPSGIYLARMEAEGYSQTRKMVLLK